MSTTKQAATTASGIASQLEAFIVHSVPGLSKQVAAMVPDAFQRLADMQEPTRRLNDCEYFVDQAARKAVGRLSDRDRAMLFSFCASTVAMRQLHRLAAEIYDDVSTLTRAVMAGLTPPLTARQAWRHIERQHPGLRITRERAAPRSSAT